MRLRWAPRKHVFIRDWTLSSNGGNHFSSRFNSQLKFKVDEVNVDTSCSAESSS